MITTQEMRKLEDASKIPKITLMENAGEGIAVAINKKLKIKNKNIVIVAYHGNNGGDGFAAAKYLSNDAQVDICFIGEESKLTEEALVNFGIIKNNHPGIQILSYELIDFDDYDFIIDAILGTGSKGEIQEPLRSIIKRMNEAKGKKIALDIPTGVDPHTGEKANIYFEPALILSLHDIKKGIASFKDKIVVVDIGLGKKS